MPEIQRFWMRLPSMNPDYSRAEAWWCEMMNRMYEEDPVSFAGMQFDAAMKLEEMRMRNNP